MGKTLLNVQAESIPTVDVECNSPMTGVGHSDDAFWYAAPPEESDVDEFAE